MLLNVISELGKDKKSRDKYNCRSFNEIFDRRFDGSCHWMREDVVGSAVAIYTFAHHDQLKELRCAIRVFLQLST